MFKQNSIIYTRWWFDKVYPCIPITVFILTYILILAYAYLAAYSIHIDFYVSVLCGSIHVDFYVPITSITYTCIFQYTFTCMCVCIFV